MERTSESIQPVQFPAESARTNGMPLWAKLVIGLGLLAIAGVLADYGLTVRKQQWDRTEQIRFFGDVSNGYGWGMVARNVGLLNVYDLYAAGRIPQYPNELDYTPLRLTIVHGWAGWAREHFPDVRRWNESYDLTRPMLMLNAAAELISSILVFLLIRMWIIRMDDAIRSPLEPPRPFRGVARGMLGAMFLWFNPCVIWDGHCFPQWDIWNAPFYLGAVFLACTNWWFAAGCCVIFGAFLKGQILLVAPIFIIWPLVQLRFDAILRFAAGFATMGAVLAFPWMHASGAAMTWYMLVLGCIALLMPIVLQLRLGAVWMAAAAIAAMLLAWPWTSHAPLEARMQALLIPGGVALSRYLPVRLRPHVAALAVAATVMLIMPLYNGSSTWYTQGFEFGTHKFMWMSTPDTYSLPEVLKRSFGWGNDANVLVELPLIGTQVALRTLMLGIYGICLTLCGIGAAMHQRRSDPRFLVAMVAPWLCWFVLLTQLNNRYMVWAAGFSGLLLGVGLGMTLLGAVVSFIGWAGIAVILCWSGRDPALAAIVRPLTPHLFWPLALAAAIYLYMAITPGRRPVRQITS